MDGEVCAREKHAKTVKAANNRSEKSVVCLYRVSSSATCKKRCGNKKESAGRYVIRVGNYTSTIPLHLRMICVARLAYVVPMPFWRGLILR